MENDARYYARRAREERVAAKGACSKKAREAHNELAIAYEHRVRVLLAEERRAAFHMVSST